MSATVDPGIIELARRLIGVSRPIALSYFRTGIAVEHKADASPVTRADREAEEAIRECLVRETPDYGILGEEYGSEGLDRDYVWVIDPIDGTRAFINGIPLFGTLIALTYQGVPVLGLTDFPALDEYWLGVAGAVTRHWGRGDDGAPVQTRACGGLSDAHLCTTSPQMFSPAQLPRYQRLSAAVRDTRFGTDCYAYAMAASGETDLVAEAGMQPYDYLAHAVVVTGAGGTITDWQGAPLTLDSPGSVLAAGDAGVHAAALELLTE